MRISIFKMNKTQIVLVLLNKLARQYLKKRYKHDVHTMKEGGYAALKLSKVNMSQGYTLKHHLLIMFRNIPNKY